METTTTQEPVKKALLRARKAEGGGRWYLHVFGTAVVAAAMVPGVLLFAPESFLKDVSTNNFRLLCFGGLCLIAATVGQSFITFVLAEAEDFMKRRHQKHLGATQAGPTQAPPSNQ